MKLEVFPDYCSTGLWNTETRVSVDPAEVGSIENDAVALGLFAGLRQWHWMWEFMVCESRLSDTATDSWANDGAALVGALNKHYAGKHTFMYCTDLLN